MYSVALFRTHHSIDSDSLRPHELYPTRLLRPWDFPGKSTGVDCRFLLQGIFPTQGLNPGLPHCRETLYRLSQQGSQYSKWCWGKVSTLLGISNQNPRRPPPAALVDFSRRQCLDASQLLNYLVQDGECQRFPYIMGIQLCLYQVAQT